MIRLLVALLLLLAAAAPAEALKADTVGNTLALGALNAHATVALAGEQGAIFHVAAGTLTGTVTPEVSMDGGSTYYAAVLLHTTTGGLSTTLALAAGSTDPSHNESRTIGYPGAITHARIRVSAYTSGTANATLRSVTTRPFTVAYGTDGTTIRGVSVDSSGNVNVVCTSGCAGTGGTSSTDEAAYTPTTTAGTPVMGARDDASVDTLAEDKVGIIRATENRALHVNLRDAAGAELAVGGGTQYNQGTATTDTDALTMAGAVRRDTAAVATGVADGDRLALSTDSAGRLRTTAVDTTQPVSGTVTANAGTNLNTSALLTTTAHDAAFGTAGSADAQVRTIQGVASMTPVQVTGTGTAGTAATAVVTVQGIASMTKLLVTPDANSAVNVAQVSGTTLSTGQGVAGTGTPRVTVSRDSDICNPIDTAQVAVSIASSGNNELVAISGSTVVYICDLTLIADGTVGVQLIYGTGTACATDETNMSGVMSLIVNTGWTHNYGGRLKTIAAQAFCIELSASVQVSGVLTYRQL